MKIKTDELQGTALDWAVAKCEKVDDYILYESFMTRWTDDEGDTYRYSTDWAQGGPIVENWEIGLKRNAPCSYGRQWEASPSIRAKGAGWKFGYGPTPLIATMRCYVAMKLGDEVDVPDELLQGEQA